MGDPLLKYKVEKDFENQGMEMRCKFNDKVSSIHQRVKELFNLEEEFGLFQICRDQNGYNRILYSITPSGDETVEEANKNLGDHKISHKSTWLLVEGDENVQKFNMLQNSLPITLKITIFEESFDLLTYNTRTISDIRS